MGERDQYFITTSKCFQRKNRDSFIGKCRYVDLHNTSICQLFIFESNHRWPVGTGWCITMYRANNKSASLKVKDDHSCLDF